MVYIYKNIPKEYFLKQSEQLYKNPLPIMVAIFWPSQSWKNQLASGIKNLIRHVIITPQQGLVEVLRHSFFFFLNYKYYVFIEIFFLKPKSGFIENAL
jgi:hypothetical protein